MPDYSALEDIPGVGPAIADNLRAAGFETPDAVMDATVDELAAVDLIGESSAETILNGDSKGRRGPEPKVDAVLEDCREQLEKPISDRAAIAQSPISRNTHKRWLNGDGEPYETYQAMYEDARAIAEERLAMDGLYGDADSSLVKFLLKATHGYEDKKQLEDVTDGSDGFGTTIVLDSEYVGDE